jgi:hypothetical protein
MKAYIENPKKGMSQIKDESNGVIEFCLYNGDYERDEL